MSYVDTIVATIESTCDKIEEVLDGIDKSAEPVVRTIVENMPGSWAIPGPVKEQAIRFAVQQIHNATKDLRKTLGTFRKLAKLLGSPDTLLEAAKFWETSAADCEALAEDVRAGNLDAMSSSTHWDDPPASEQYAKEFDGQSMRVGKIHEYALNLSDALTAFAEAIEDYYKNLLKAVVSFQVAGASLALAIAGCVSVVGVGAAVMAAVSAVLAIISAVQAVMDLVNAASKDNSQKIREISGASWPMPSFA